MITFIFPSSMDYHRGGFSFSKNKVSDETFPYKENVLKKWKKKLEA